MKTSRDETYINSIVGPGTFFRGHLELSGLLRVDGDFSGSIVTDGRVIVGQEGRADCAIEAGSVVVGGLFKGDMLAYEKVVLLSSSVVIGSITAPRLIVEEGVLFTGRFKVTGAGEAIEPTGQSSQSRKDLLLETMRRRENSNAAGAGNRDPGQTRQDASHREEPIAAAIPAGQGERS